MRFIITGQKGLIGEHLKKELDKEHECVLAIDKRYGEHLSDLDKYDIKADIFFHLASFCKINEGTKNPDRIFEDNVAGVSNALEYCRTNGIKKFVFFSSSRVLAREENPYTSSKKYGERLCEAYRQCYGIEYLIVRPSTIYGEHDDLTGRLITNWIQQAIKGETLEIYGNEYKTLDFTYISDFNDGIKILLDNWGMTKNKAFDISGEEEVKLVDLAAIIGDELNKVIKYEFTLPEIAQPQRISIDISQMKAFGYEPKIKLKEGVKRMCAYYKK